MKNKNKRNREMRCSIFLSPHFIKVLQLALLKAICVIACFNDSCPIIFCRKVI